MSDLPEDPQQPVAPEQELAVDLSAFLPEGVRLAGAEDRAEDEAEEEIDDLDPPSFAQDDVAPVEDAGPDGNADPDDKAVEGDGLVEDADEDDETGDEDADRGDGADPDDEAVDAEAHEAEPVVEPDFVEPEFVAPPREPVDVAALEQVARDLDGVNAALEALDNGTYGACRACGQPIEEERLAADPTSLDCARHAPA